MGRKDASRYADQTDNGAAPNNSSRPLSPSNPSASNTYGICRQSSAVSIAQGNEFAAWFVSITRRNKAYQRSFSLSTYGGELPALRMAKAYRDAIIRLAPPETTNKSRTVPTTRTRGPIPGVFRCVSGKKLMWVATMSTTRGLKTRKFSIRLYGEEEAKKLAIKARNEFLGSTQNRFYTQDASATQVAAHWFEDMLRPSADSVPSKAAIARAEKKLQSHVDQLNQWFDALCPQYVRVHSTCGMNDGRPTLYVAISVPRSGIAPMRKAWGMRQRSLQETRPLAWDFIRETLTALTGAEWYKAFSRKHRSAFMAVNETQAADVRMRWISADMSTLENPPSALAEVLPGFTIPRQYMP